MKVIIKKIIRKKMAWLSIFFASLGLCVLGAYVYFELTAEPPREPLTQCNAIWIGHTWIEEEHSEQEIWDMADKLRDHDIDCLYLHATPLMDDGSFDESRAQYLTYFLETYRQRHEATIYAWLGILTPEYEEPSISYKFALDDYTRITKIQDTAFELVDNYDLDGVQLDVEPVISGSSEYLTLLSGIHRGMEARGKKLSLATMYLTDEKRRELAAQDNEPLMWSWEAEYFDTVALFCDQLVVMHYNVGLTDGDEFSARVVEQMKVLQAGRENGAAMLMGLPAYDYKYDEAENLASGLAGVIAGQKQGLELDGIAIYAQWTMDEAEWGLL